MEREVVSSVDDGYVVSRFANVVDLPTWTFHREGESIFVERHRKTRKGRRIGAGRDGDGWLTTNAQTLKLLGL